EEGWKERFAWHSASGNSTPTISFSRVFIPGLEEAGICVHIFVAAAGKVEDNQVLLGQFRQPLHEPRNRVRRLERWNDPFGSRKHPRRFERRLVGHRGILGASLIRKPSMFRANRGIIKSRRDRVRRSDLPVFVLQNVSVRALK